MRRVAVCVKMAVQVWELAHRYFFTFFPAKMIARTVIEITITAMHRQTIPAIT
jgi:hypothetical protein